MKPIVFDTETSNHDVLWGALTPWHDQSRVHIVSWATDAANPKAARVTDDSSLRRFIEYLLRYDVIAAHNLVFDAAYLLAACDRNGWNDLYRRLINHRWLDTVLLWKRVDRMHRLYLRKIAPKTPGYGLKRYAEEIGEPYEDGDIDFQSLEYAAKDARITMLLLKWAWRNLDPRERRSAFDEGASCLLFAESWLQGFLFDGAALSSAKKELTGTMESKAAEAGVEPKVLRSDAQRLAWMKSKGWSGSRSPSGELMLTDSGNLSTNVLAMEVAAKKYPWAVPVKDFVRAKTMATKFVNTPLRALALSGNGKAYPSPTVAGTYTGRATYSSRTKYSVDHTFKNGKTVKRNKIAQTGIAIHQWPHDPIVRKLIVAPPGYTIAAFDASSQEMRFMMVQSGDRTMEQVFRDNLKAHAVMAASIYDHSYDDIMAEREGALAKEYKLGKLANLSLQFRTGAARLCDIALKQGMWLELSEAKRISATYRRTYRSVPKYWDRAIAKAKEQGYAETLGGRKLHLDEFGWRGESAAINFPIQGSGGDMKYRALADTRHLLGEFDAKFLLDMHDGLYFLVPDAVAQDFERAMLFALDHLDYSDWGPLPIPLTWESKLGKNFGEL